MTEEGFFLVVLSFALGCFCGSRFKENQFSARLNYLKSEFYVLKDRVGDLETQTGARLRPPTTERRT